MHAAHAVDMCIRCSELSQTAVWVFAGGGTTGGVGEADGDGAGAGGAAALGARRPGRCDGAGAGPVHGDPLSAKEYIFLCFVLEVYSRTVALFVVVFNSILICA